MLESDDMDAWTKYAPGELEALSGIAEGFEFSRTEMRKTKNRRELTCGHIIDPREPYRYQVFKLHGIAGLTQVLECDVCMRVDNRY